MGMHSTNHPPRQPHPRGAAIRPVPPFRSLQGVLLLHPPVLIHSRRVPPCVLCALLLASTRPGPRALFFSHRSFLAGRAHLISSADRGFPGHLAHSHWAGRRILPQESPTTTSAAYYYLKYNPNLPEVRPPQSTLPRRHHPRAASSDNHGRNWHASVVDLLDACDTRQPRPIRRAGRQCAGFAAATATTASAGAGAAASSACDL